MNSRSRPDASRRLHRLLTLTFSLLCFALVPSGIVGQSDSEAADAPAIEVPENGEAAGALDQSTFESALAKQPPERLFELLDAWGSLLARQVAHVDAAKDAEEGTPERTQLDKRTTDRDAVLEQAKSIVREVRSREGLEVTGQAAAVVGRIQEIQEALTPAPVSATASDEEKAQAAEDFLEENTTVPQDPATAHQADLDVLAARLRPLTRDQVGKDLDAWLSILRNVATEVRNVEVSALQANADEEERFNERLISVKDKRDKLIRRVRAVIDAFKAKGGDEAEAKDYVDSIVVAPVIKGFNAFMIQTRATVWKWLTDPEGGLAMLVSVLKFIGILLAFRILGRIVSSILRRALGAMRKSSDLLRAFVINSTRKVISFIGIVVALSQLGVNIGPFLAAIGAAGFVIGFALQGTLSNFASGVMIMLYRPYDVGDVVNAAGVSGTVDSMTLVSTTIKTFDNQSIVVPNNKIWGDVITNVTANPTRRIDMVFGVGYDDDLDKAREVLEAVVTEHEKVLKDPAPTIKLHSYSDSSIDFIVRPWAKTADYWGVYWDIHAAMKKRFDQAGLSIPFPQRDVHVYQHLTGDGANGSDAAKRTATSGSA